jgi:hypothetical protein
LLALAVLTALHAEQSEQKPAFKANADYVEIPVRVLDKKGLVIRDLTQSDFEILEDGAPQRIVNFAFHASSSPRRPPPDDARETSEPASTTHLYVVVLDDFHISREDTSKLARLSLNSFGGMRRLMTVSLSRSPAGRKDRSSRETGHC